MSQYDVVIAGAGMVGAAIGCFLGQAGMRVALVDPLPPQDYNASSVPDLRVSALSPASQKVLQDVNAWQHIESMRSCIYKKMAVWEKLREPLTQRTVSSRFNQTLFDCNALNLNELGFIVENNITQLALHKELNKLEHVDLYSPASPKQLFTRGNERYLILDNGEKLEAQLIIGADGANSFIRQQAGIRLSREDYEQRALVATVEITHGPLDITWQAFTPKGPLALLPLPSVEGKHYVSLVWYNHPEDISELMALSDELFLEQVQAHFPKELPEIIRLNSRGSFPLVKRYATDYIKEGIALAGDAAHTINPLAGQGVNLGFQDVSSLSRNIINTWKRGEDTGAVNSLINYQKERMPENRRMQLIMDAFYHLFSNDIAPVKVLRNAGLTLAGNFSWGRKQVMRYAMGLGKLSKH